VSFLTRSQFVKGGGRGGKLIGEGIAVVSK